MSDNRTYVLPSGGSAASLIALIEQLLLEQGENSCKTPNRPYLIGTHSDSMRAVIFQPNCGKWDCPFCARHLQKMWMLRGMLFVDDRPNDKDFNFVTVTSSGKLKTFEQTFDVFPDAWAKLHNRMVRYDRQFDYLVIPELHKDGRVHAHMITDFETPKTYFVHRRERTNTRRRRVRKDGFMDSFWRDIPPLCGFGWSNDQEPLNDEVSRVAQYIAKELTKQLGVKHWPANFRRVRVSDGVPAAPVESQSMSLFDWQAFTTPEAASERLELLKLMGFRFLDHTSGELI